MTRVVEVVGASYAVRGVELVSAIDLGAGSGELVAVVGPNGAGKTTLLRLLAGDLEPTTGSVTVAGTAASVGEGLARVRAVLPQHHALQFAFRALEVVMLGRYPHDSEPEEDRDVVTRAMETTDTLPLAERVFPTLSGGEQTRVAFARVLAQETPVVLLDEPTSSLDLRHQELVMQALRGIADGGGTVVTVLHDLNLASRYADRVVLMDRGRIAADGPPGTVLTEALLERVYATAVRVVPHPDLGTPVILANGGRTAS